MSIKAVLLIGILMFFPVFLIIGGLYGMDFSIRIKAAIYIVFFLFPMMLIFYNEIKNNPLDATYRNLLAAYIIIGLLLFFLYKYGILAWNRYQHVGNILGATSILFFGLSNKRHKWILFFTWLVLVLSVGSRQALFGLFFCGMIYIFVGNYRVFLTFLASSTLIYFNSEFILEKVSELAYKYDLNTLLRVIYAINTGGGNSANTRLEIYNNLIHEIKLLPNLNFSPNHDLLLPHNFFLEYFIVCGFLLGIIFLVFIIWLISKSIMKNRESVLVYFTLFYFISFNVSTGIGAAKYFIYYCFLLIIILEKRKYKKRIDGKSITS
jgi:hypothetical protein